MEDYDFQTEYAKSGRAACKGCSGNITQGSLRLATLVQSPFFDGKVSLWKNLLRYEDIYMCNPSLYDKMAKWFHMQCFFKKSKVRKLEEIKGIETIRYEDQEKLRGIINGTATVGVAKEAAASNSAYDYTVQYAKSSRAKCRSCDISIQKGEIRLSKKVYDSLNAKMYGPQDLWHHVDCFIKEREELGYDLDQQPKILNGFSSIDKDDQNMLIEKLGKGKNISKRKIDGGGDVVDAKVTKKLDKNEELYKEQSKKLWEITDALNKAFNIVAQRQMLEENDMFIPSGLSGINLLLSDVIYFGCPVPCVLCGGLSYYKSGAGYKCTGDISEWTKCTQVTKTPSRVAFKVDQEWKDECPYLKRFKIKVRDRFYMEDKDVPTEELPLKGLDFSICGRFGKGGVTQKSLRERVTALGGVYVKKVLASTTACITTPDEVKNEALMIKECKRYNIHCVGVDFLDNLKGIDIVDAIPKYSLSDWGKFVSRSYSGKSYQSEKSEKRRQQEERKYQISDEMMTSKMKGGLVVDPDSGLSDTHHVYKERDAVYNSILGLVDVVKGTNSYYKLQILEKDESIKANKPKYYLWRSWGRIGTTIGGDQLAHFTNKQECVARYKELFEEKTGNMFNSPPFVKQPRKFYPIDVDFGAEMKTESLKNAGSRSKLEKPVQELIKLIFDVDKMTNDMLEFEIDLKKMPLGKISQNQIREAFSILTDLQKTLDKGKHSENAILDASNRFYTVIPHDFGMKKPPLIKDNDIISAKTLMLQNLLDIEIAYSMLTVKKDEKGGDTSVDPLDYHYNKLNTKLHVLEKSSDEYNRLIKFVKNTHASTHNQFDLNVQEIFEVERQGEKKRFKAFRDLPNHQLLWHGSGITNYAGILSQGLRIAPPEAPVTGYMFGKGVYFADMVSKSANYCRTTKSNPIGLLMLCEVALGNMHTLKKAQNIMKVKSGKHSVKGLGQTMPDPGQTYTDPDGLAYPMGTPVNSDVANSTLLYNEFIVYDVAQIKVKYLLKTEFKYKY